MIPLIEQYFDDLSDIQKTQFLALGPLYAEWNQKINVISRKDIDNFYEHHVLHSLAIAKAIQFVPGTKVMDIGTGGGFPGVPLAILFPEVSFTLVDSVGKKLKVIDAIADEIGLRNIKTIHERAENIPGQFDFVVSRAVTRLNEAWGWAHGSISSTQRNTLPNGLLYLKGGDISAETPASVSVQRWELADWFKEPYFAEKSLVLLSDSRHNNT
ncbi:MAG: 16S rRNA (guanine(527)-N(7))-methyltransferase RsmG [Candidatus Saccharimonadales bacterium]